MDFRQSRTILKKMLKNTIINQKQWSHIIKFVAITKNDFYAHESLVELSSQLPHIKMLRIENDSEITTDFEIFQQPHILIFDKNTNLKYYQQFIGFNLQQKIDELINQKCLSELQEQQLLNYQNQKQKQKYFKIKQIFCEDQFDNNYKDKIVFSIKAEGRRSWWFDKYKTTAQIIIQYSQYDINLLNYFKHSIDGISDLKIEQKLIELIQIPSGQQCVQCKKQFGSELYYWCKWDQFDKQFRCIKCIKKKIENQYTYKNNAVLTNGKNMLIARNLFGNNLQPQSNHYERPHSFLCDYCGQMAQENTVRYICLSCYPQPKQKRDHVNFCQQCMNKYINNNGIIINKLKFDHNHNLDDAFLRIIFNKKGYYNY